MNLDFWILFWIFLFVFFFVFRFLFFAGIAFIQTVNTYPNYLIELLIVLVVKKSSQKLSVITRMQIEAVQIPMEDFICIFHCFQIRLSTTFNRLSRLVSFPEKVTTFRLYLCGSDGVKL